MSSDKNSIERAETELFARMDELFNSVKLIEERLELSPGTISQATGQADSVAVIMMIATVETILNEVISAALSAPTGGLGGRPASEIYGGLAAIAHSLPLDGSRGSKLAFASSMGLISEQDENFARALAKIRNRFAHSIRNAERSLRDIICEMIPSDKKLFWRISYGYPDSYLDLDDFSIKLIVTIAFSQFLANIEGKFIELNSGIRMLLDINLPRI